MNYSELLSFLNITNLPKEQQIQGWSSDHDIINFQGTYDCKRDRCYSGSEDILVDIQSFFIQTRSREFPYGSEENSRKGGVVCGVQYANPSTPPSICLESLLYSSPTKRIGVARTPATSPLSTFPYNGWGG